MLVPVFSLDQEGMGILCQPAGALRSSLDSAGVPLPPARAKNMYAARGKGPSQFSISVSVSRSLRCWTSFGITSSPVTRATAPRT